MRVALDTTPLLGGPTGIGAFADGLLRSMVDRPDVEVAAFAMTLRGFRDVARALPDGVRTPRPVPMPAGALSSWWRRHSWPKAQWWTGNVDIVHGTNFVVPPSGRAAALVTVHDLTAVRFPELCLPHTRKYPDFIGAAVGRGADVHVPSQAMADDVIDLLEVEPSRVHVVYLAPAPVSSDVGATAQEGRRIAGSERYVLALGTVEPRKDHVSLVRAFADLAAADPDLRLVVAGGEGWGSERFEQAVASSPWRERIVRTGRVVERDRVALLRGATVLAYPSLYEGFGLPPLEAMAEGVPVVATAAGGVPEVVGDAACLVPVGDVDALAAALSRVLNDDDDRRRLVDAGKARAASFSWARTAEQMRLLYGELVAR